MSTITTILGGDLISDSRDDINANFTALNNEKIETSYISTDNTLGGTSPSDSKIPTEKAINEFVVATASPTGKSWNEYAEANSGTDAYTISVPGVTAYVTGQTFKFKADVANTGSCTLNVNGLGAKAIKKLISSDLSTNDILANQAVTVTYDGTNMQMVSFVPSQSPTSLPIICASGTTSKNTATGTNTIAHGLGVTPSMVKVKAVIHFNILNGSSAAQDVRAEANVISGTTSAIHYSAINGATGSWNRAGTGFILYEGGNTNTGTYAYLTGAITVDGTNITIDWTRTHQNYPDSTNTIIILWEAIK